MWHLSKIKTPELGTSLMSIVQSFWLNWDVRSWNESCEARRRSKIVIGPSNKSYRSFQEAREKESDGAKLWAMKDGGKKATLKIQIFIFISLIQKIKWKLYWKFKNFIRLIFVLCIGRNFEWKLRKLEVGIGIIWMHSANFIKSQRTGLHNSSLLCINLSRECSQSGIDCGWLSRGYRRPSRRREHWLRRDSDRQHCRGCKCRWRCCWRCWYCRRCRPCVWPERVRLQCAPTSVWHTTHHLPPPNTYQLYLPTFHAIGWWERWLWVSEFGRWRWFAVKPRLHCFTRSFEIANVVPERNNIAVHRDLIKLRYRLGRANHHKGEVHPASETLVAANKKQAMHSLKYTK